MHLTTEDKKEIFKTYGGSETNTGSAEAQVAMFTQRITYLTGHLKINKKDLTSIVSAFGRYNYEIKATFHESIFDDDLQSRYEQFMNYLNM
mgnify:CR=1 FL=1